MIVSELQYFPPVSFFSALYKKTYVYLDVYEIYHKMSFRNRCLIAGAEGVISLSVPLLEGRNQNRPMNGVMISNADNWQARHFKSIQSAYNRSPFFEYYRHELATVFLKRFELLAEWDLYCLNWVKEKLGCRMETPLTEKAVPFGTEGITDLRNLVLPKNYTRWNPVKYRQVFEERTGFFPNLSILDLLFNEGKNAAELLRNSNIEI